jgi:glucans biosynthesis protein C
MDSARPVDRRYDLDALRVLAVLLLIVFHSARVFDVFDPFYVKSPETSDPLSWAVVAFLNPWHMPLLFVLAGAATWLALGHRGPKAYVGERTRRLLIPFLFGVLLIVPPQAFLASRFRGDDGSAASFLGDYWTVEGDLTGYDGSFTPAHLWFIGFLFIFSLVALPLFVRWHGRRLRTRWLLFAMPLVLVAADELPAPNDGPQNPWYSLALFVAGFLLLADERAEGLVQRRWRPLLAAAVVTMTTVMLVWSSGTGDGWSDGSPLDVGFSVLEEANTWLWVLALLGAGKALLGSPIRGLRYASEASFPFYVLHQTVIVAVAYLVVGWNLGVGQKFATVGLASLVLTLLVYELVVRRTRATRFLFGMRSAARSGSGAKRGLWGHAGDAVAVDVVPSQAGDHDLAVVGDGDRFGDVGEAEEVDRHHAGVGEAGVEGAVGEQAGDGEVGVEAAGGPGDDDPPVGLEGDGGADVAAGDAGRRAEAGHRHVDGAVAVVAERRVGGAVGLQAHHRQLGDAARR